MRRAGYGIPRFVMKIVPKRHKFGSQMRNRLREFLIAVPTQKSFGMEDYYEKEDIWQYLPVVLAYYYTMRMWRTGRGAICD